MVDEKEKGDIVALAALQRQGMQEEAIADVGRDKGKIENSGIRKHELWDKFCLMVLVQLESHRS